MDSAPAPVLFTVGHGDRTTEEFPGLIAQSSVRVIVDSRAYPVSRRHPWFARASLEPLRARAGIRHLWDGRALGGRRSVAADSPHVALADPQLRACADHIDTLLYDGGRKPELRL